MTRVLAPERSVTAVARLSMTRRRSPTTILFTTALASAVTAVDSFSGDN